MGYSSLVQHRVKMPYVGLGSPRWGSGFGRAELHHPAFPCHLSTMEHLPYPEAGHRQPPQLSTSLWMHLDVGGAGWGHFVFLDLGCTGARCNYLEQFISRMDIWQKTGEDFPEVENLKIKKVFINIKPS